MKKGFTLIEIMIVVAIIGLMVALFLPIFTTVKKNDNLNKEAAEYGLVIPYFDTNGERETWLKQAIVKKKREALRGDSEVEAPDPIPIPVPVVSPTPSDNEKPVEIYRCPHGCKIVIIPPDPS